jgi:uncharacterized protein (TIGR01619 family)
MKKICLTMALIVSTAAFIQAQEDWDNYIAQYDDGPGSVTINMARKETAPVKTLPFVVVTGLTTTKDCEADGFPLKKELDRLQNANDAAVAVVKAATTSELVGTFLYECERLAYIYVHDTAKIREKLTNLYKTKYPAYKYYINIKPDNAWEYYLDFLYPNDEIMEFMDNEKVIEQLRQAGDKLDKPRAIDYVFYFSDEKGREAFIKAVAGQGFKAEKAYVKEAAGKRYQVVLTRVGMVEVSEISQTTLELKKKAEEHGGEYDGWNTTLEKK